MYHETECGCGQHGHGEQNGMGHAQSECDQHVYPVGIRLHHSSSCDCGCDCGCGGHHGGGLMQRRFVSKEEVTNQLEDYLKQLKAEAKGVEERIAEIKKG
jgi:hypothetical protein